MITRPARGAVLAFDFGEKRIGVAVGGPAMQALIPALIVSGRARASATNSATLRAGTEGCTVRIIGWKEMPMTGLKSVTG